MAEPQPIGDLSAELTRPLRGPFSSHANRRNRDTSIHGGSVMLVLSRRSGEQIVIDGKIKITIIEIPGGRCGLASRRPQRFGFCGKSWWIGRRWWRCARLEAPSVIRPVLTNPPAASLRVGSRRCLFLPRPNLTTPQ